jgi:hypothetical protein
MQSGTAAGLFTSNGTTSPATAENLVNWYLAQASAASAVGDSSGAEAFRTRAEEFRIQALRDVESVLDNAYQNGNAIDLALIGGSGSAKIDGAEYEKWLNEIIDDPAMTSSDRERLQSKLFTVSYNYAAENMVNGFNEDKYTANQLVSFYEKEMKRAIDSGLTETSKTYRDIVSAKATAVQRAESDALQGRVDSVENGIRGETDAMADAIQRLIKPVIGNYFSSSDVITGLTSDIGKGDGDDWLVRFAGAVQSGKIDYVQLFDAGASANGLTSDQMREIASVFGDLTSQVDRLKNQGYLKELGNWIPFADEMSTAYTDGAFAASTRPFVTSFNSSYAKVGGSIGVPFSGEPSASASALSSLIGNIAGAGSENNVSDSQTTNQVSTFGQGMIPGLIAYPAMESVEDLVNYLSKTGATSGMDKTDIANGIAEWLFVSKTNPSASITGPISQELYNLGMVSTMLDNQIGGSGGLTSGDILRLYIESVYIPESIRTTLDAGGNPTRAQVYKMDPKTGEFAFKVIPSGNISSSDYVITAMADGSVYYTQSIPYTGGEVGAKAIKFVPVPGGGNYAAGNDANDLIVIDFTGGVGDPVALTASQIEDFSSWYAGTPGAASGGDFSGFRLEPDQATPGVMKFVGGVDLIKLLGQTWAAGPGSTFSDWINARGISLKDISVKRYGSTLILGKDFIPNFRMEIFTSGVQGSDVKTAVKDWLNNVKGISDGTGKIASLILGNLGSFSGTSGSDGITWNMWSEGNYYTNSTDDTRDKLPPVPTSTLPDPRDTAGGNPGFGMEPGLGGRPSSSGAVIGGTAGVRGTGNAVIPDMMEHTFRNLTGTNTDIPALLPGPAGSGGGPSIGPSGVDGPTVTAPSVAPGTKPTVLPQGPSMRPMASSSKYSARELGVGRTGMRNL